jgi:hypothetical protein
MANQRVEYRAHRAAGQLRLEVGDIFRAFGDAYRKKNDPPLEVRRVMKAIESCRTAALGGHLDVCHRCGYQQPAYNSCRNRHCPKCQGRAQAEWIAQRKERILPTRHFHVVFTLPEGLRPMAMGNRRLIFDLLLKTAATTLMQFGRDPRWIGAQLGLTAVLHTWTRDLQFHPHAHCLVTDGGLSKDGRRWVRGRGRGKFLFPVKAVAEVFRAKFMRALTRLREAGRLQLSSATATDEGWSILRKQLFSQRWIVYSKAPFRRAEHIYEYLGRYTHRVGISNSRLISLNGDRICFRTKGDKTTTIKAEEFIRRFLLHILPPGFAKIRHYGLLSSSNAKTRLEIARALLVRQANLDHQPPLEDAEDDPAAFHDPPKSCPRCQLGFLVPSLEEIDPAPPPS